MGSVRIIGMGRAGSSFAGALSRVGWSVEGLSRDDSIDNAAMGVDLVLLCTPDSAVRSVAGAVAAGDAVVAHTAGALGLDALAPHSRVAAIHPLISLPNGEIGAERLLDSGWFATAGDPLAEQLVSDLGGRSFQVADSDRAVYHAAACIAANHVVALLGQTQRLAADIGVPFDAYLELTQWSVQNAADLGPGDALTGPAARGDSDTIRLHLESLPADERASYQAMVGEAERLARESSQ